MYIHKYYDLYILFYDNYFEKLIHLLYVRYFDIIYIIVNENRSVRWVENSHNFIVSSFYESSVLRIIQLSVSGERV